MNWLFADQGSPAIGREERLVSGLDQVNDHKYDICVNDYKHDIYVSYYKYDICVKDDKC